MCGWEGDLGMWVGGRVTWGSVGGRVTWGCVGGRVTQWHVGEGGRVLFINSQKLEVGFKVYAQETSTTHTHKNTLMPLSISSVVSVVLL